MGIGMVIIKETNSSFLGDNHGDGRGGGGGGMAGVKATVIVEKVYRCV